MTCRSLTKVQSTCIKYDIIGFRGLMSLRARLTSMLHHAAQWVLNALSVFLKRCWHVYFFVQRAKYIWRCLLPFIASIFNAKKLACLIFL